MLQNHATRFVPEYVAVTLRVTSRVLIEVPNRLRSLVKRPAHRAERDGDVESQGVDDAGRRSLALPLISVLPTKPNHPVPNGSDAR